MLWHIDSGSNVHICTDKQAFYKLFPISSSVQKVSGSKVNTQGLGIVILQLSATYALPIYPVFYIPSNPQHTLSLSSLKHHNKFHEVRVSPLDDTFLLQKT